MLSNKKLSLQQAILINVNIMLGAGIFINTVELAREAGALGFVSYFIIGIMILPLIISIAQLVSLYPIGGFYTFGSQALTPFAGFISTWSYFIGKLASAVLMIHASVLLLQQILPLLQLINTVALDISVLTIYTLLNLLHTETGATIQKWFMIIKCLPLMFVIIAGFFVFDSTYLTSENQLWAGLPRTLPLVLYATLGFEAICSLSDKIQDAARNGPRAILASYGIVLFIALLYQFFFYGSTGTLLGLQPSYLEAFPLFLQRLFNSAYFIQKMNIVINITIAVSALGGAYGIMYSNMWNLYTLAQHNYLFGSSIVTRLNKHHIPIAAAIIEGIIGFIYIFVTQGQQLPLQQTGALGVTIAYTISALALFTNRLKKSNLQWIIPFLALFSCIILIISCINSFLYYGAGTLILFLVLLSLGISMFIYRTLTTTTVS